MIGRGVRISMALLVALAAGLPAAAAEGPAPAAEAGFGQGDELLIGFGDPMQVWDNAERDDLVALDPSVPVRCAWSDDTTLACRPRDGRRFAAATRYRVRVKADLATQAGMRLPTLTLEAETARPVARAWVAGWDVGVPLIDVSSEPGVDEAALAAVLRLGVDGTVVDLPPLQRQPRRGAWDTDARYRVALPALDGGPRHLELSVEPGLRSSEGPLRGTQSGLLLAAVAGEPFRLRAVSCDGALRPVVPPVDEGALTVDCPPGEPLALVLSSMPDAASRKAFEAALPGHVRLRSWGDDWEWWRQSIQGRDAAQIERGHRVELEIEAAGQDTGMSAALGVLRAERGGVALESVDLVVRTGDYRPALVVPRRRALVADGAKPPVMALATNVQAPLGLDVVALGAEGMRSEAIGIEASSQRNVAVPVRSRVAAEVLAEGGWARWEMPTRQTQRHAAGDAFQSAAPGFDLVAVSGRREVLAWASTWDDGAGVAGARVELLLVRDAGSQPERIARATTGADGVARLAVPEDFGLEPPDESGSRRFPMWLLRAEAGRGRGASRAVLPLGTTWNYGVDLGLRAPTRMWGVADRPLYRAGDTVHYRLWQRQVAGGRLSAMARSAPLELSLYHQDEYKVIRTWPVVPAADGSITDGLALPVHLSDGTYCIGTGETWDIKGTCFFVGTYRAQDLWVEARSDDAVLGDGDRFVVEFEAGFYSGGAAAGVPVSEVTGMLVGRPLQEEYPQYAGFTFIDVMGAAAQAGIRLEEPEGERLRTDADGRLMIERPLVFRGDDPDAPPELPAFGRLQLVAEARLADREGTTSNAASARYARHARYVGLRLHPRWLDARTPVEVEAVVIDAHGGAVADARVQVEVHFLTGSGADETPSGDALARCDVAAGSVARCEFPRARSGRYRISARSEGAAPARIVQYVHVDGASTTSHTGGTALELIEAPARAGDPVRVLLRQPHEHARVLFVHSSGDAILGHRLVEMDGTTGTWELERPGTAGRGAQVGAYVVAAGPAATEDGYRVPRSITRSSVSFASPDRAADEPPLALAFEAGRARPGATAHIVLRNGGSSTRDVVLAVVDDALRALGSEYLDYFDPEGPHWLGQLRDGFQVMLDQASFASWGRGGVRLALPAGPGPADAGRSPSPSLPAPPGEPPVVFDDPSPMDAMGGQLSMVSSGAPPAPSPLRALDGGESTQLDRITVTGSRIAMTEIFHAGALPERDLRPRRREPAPPVRPRARVRTRFADTALWQSDIRLAPGEERSIELVLPDNLTRWRAVAWSSDADDGFHMAEAALETGLPLEVRLQAPVRIYPGDSARLAANVRQAGEADAVALGRLVVEGMETPLSHAEEVPLAARGQGSLALVVAPLHTGQLQATASAEVPDASDAVAASVEVASPVVEGRKVQAGWLQHGELVLDVPGLPPGAGGASLDIELSRGIDALVKPWTRDLHDYPHRCWEQILSRAVAAALAIERGNVADWPDAAAVVQEALDNAAVFQDEEGGFRFFADSFHDVDSGHGRATRMVLAAYTVRAFDLLRALDHPVPAHVDGLARTFLASQRSADSDPLYRADVAALGADALADAGAGRADALWTTWDMLSLPARIATARVLAKAGHPAAPTAVERLLGLAPERGAVRVLSLPPSQGIDPWMSSRLREHCALIGLLGDHPGLAPPDARRELVAGLRDLYAGGIQAVDTQAGAQCLMALRDLARPDARQEAAFTLDAGDGPVELVLPADEDVAMRTLALGDGGRTLRITPGRLPPAGASYIAALDYREDARIAQPSAVGLSVERRYDVLRDGAWAPLDDGAGVGEGDWLRVSLLVHTSKARYHVALTDAVPGGLRPTDLALGGIAGLDLARVSDEGSHWFATRRLDPRSPRFYAERLPAGRHEVHYFARAGNAGDYLAAPAVAELMYGDASRARTGARRLVIAAGGD